MRVGQIAPGLSSESMLEVGRVNGAELVAFVTEQRLFVASRSLHVLAQYELADEVVCIRWSDAGKLAVLLRGGEVVVFLPELEQSDRKVGMRVLSKVKLGSNGSACCWKRNQEQLLVACLDRSLCLYDLSAMFVRDGVLTVAANELWRRSDLLVNPAAMLAFSADNRFFASCAVADPLVKIFQEPANGFGSDDVMPRFFYLRHPQAVVRFSWRDTPSLQVKEQMDVPNVLLTSCCDEGHRIWMEMHVLELQIQFSLVASLDVVPGTVVSWLQKEENEYMAASRVKEQRQQQQALPSSKIYSVSDDWLVGMDSSGAVVVWGLQNLVFSNVQKLPSVFIWNKLAPLEMIERAPKIIAGSSRYPMQQDKSSGAAMLHLLVLTQQGRLSSWRFALRSNLASANRSLMGVFWGHQARHPICHVAASQCAPLVCSVDTSGRAIIAESMRTALADPPIIVCEILGLENVSMVCWISQKWSGKNSDVLAVCSRSNPSELSFLKLSRGSALSKFESKLIGKVQLPATSDCSRLLIASQSGSSEALLVGIGQAGKAVFVLLPLEDPEKARVIKESPEAGFRCASACHPLFADDDGAQVHRFVLGSDSGQVSFWNEQGECLGSFSASSDGRAVVGLSCAYTGRFASHSEGSNEIRVWELESSTSMQVSQECTVACSSDHVLMDWLELGNGSHSLIVVSGSDVRLLLETGSRRLQSFAVNWTDACSVLDSVNGKSSAVAALSDGTLVIACGSELHFATKWISDEDTSSDLRHASFFGKAEALLKPLPLYHPKVLVEYMMGGRFEMVETILSGLLQHLEQGAGERLAVPEPSLEIILSPPETPFSSSSSTSSFSSSANLFGEDDRDLKGSSSSKTSSRCGPQDARRLSEMLSQISLPGVSRKSQLHLLAVIDTFRQILEAGPGLDPCGTRFFISLKIFQFLRKTNFGQAEFSVSNWAWAMQSQAHDVLLGHAGGGSLTLEEVRLLGLPLWLKNPDKMKQVAESLAKVQFLAKKDPFDCMLLYVALKRLSVLSKMFKVAKKDKVAEFLVNDFSQERWQTAALKNGYAMLKQQQFVQAAAFFLVAGKIRDCLGLLLKHEKDYMMAVIVARLWEGSMGGEHVRWVLEDHVVPLAQTTGDAWLLCIARWLLGDFVGSFDALLESSVDSRPYAVALSMSDFQPVVLYFTKHLLSATELVKHKKLDKPTFERLRRKTVYATLSAGCVHHCLDLLSCATDDGLVVGEGKHEQRKILSATVVPAAAKKPAYVDTGIFMAFDDGFGDMPTPDWMLPKGAESNNAQAASVGKEEDSVLSENLPLPLSSEAGLEALKVKASLMYLVGACPRVLEMCRKEGKWTDARSFLLNSASFLQARLEGGKTFQEKLLTRFNAYCEKYYHIAVQFVLLDADQEVREAFFLHHAWEIASTVADCLTASRPPPSLQASNLAAVSNELVLCFRQFAAPVSLVEKVAIAVLLGQFVSAWIAMDFDALHLVLIGEPFVKDSEERNDVSGAKEGDDDEAHSIVLDVVKLVLLDVLYYRLEAVMVSSLDGVTLDKALAKLNAKSLEVKVIESLKRYRVDLVDALHARFDFVSLKFAGREEELSLSNNWLAVLQATKDYLKGGAFARVCDKLVTLDALERVLNGAGVLAMLRSKLALAQSSRRGGDGQKVKFDNPITLIHESDILQHFCVGLGERVLCVVATSRGQAEISLEDLERSAVASLQQQQKFKNTTETNLMRLSPERLVNKLQQNLGPNIPPNAFLSKTDVACCVTSHPTLPFYLTAGVDGSVCLHQYGFPELLTPYRIGPSARMNCVKFSASGSRFGAVDESGQLSLWQFESSLESQRPYSVFQCHTKRAHDVCFLESGNVIATAGLSKKGHSAANVAVWDTLIPPSKGRIAGFGGHPKGATTILYSETQRLLISGGKSGEVCLWDMRMLKLLSSTPAHTLNVRALALDSARSILASGSSDGSMKVWTLPDMSEVATFADAHKQQTFTKNQSKYLTSPISTFGVMNIVFWKNKLLSSGADGRLVLREFK